MATYESAQRSFDRALPPEPRKPVEFSLEDWSTEAPDAFNDALAEIFADESADLFFNRYERGEMAGYTNVTRVVERMDDALARLENSIMPPSWMSDLRARRCASGCPQF